MSSMNISAELSRNVIVVPDWVLIVLGVVAYIIVARQVSYYMTPDLKTWKGSRVSYENIRASALTFGVVWPFTAVMYVICICVWAIGWLFDGRPKDDDGKGPK